MILPLRRRHRLTMVALAILLPGVYSAALLLRPPAPPTEALPSEVALAPPAVGPGQVGRELGRWEDLWQGARLATRLVELPSGRRAVALTPDELPPAPDLLVYWTAEAPAGPPGSTAALPAAVFLLGSLPAVPEAALPLPRAAAATPGHLLLYSLAHQRVVAHAALPAAAEAGG